MGREQPADFETAFADLLLAGLRRQGEAHGDERVRSIMRRVLVERGGDGREEVGTVASAIFSLAGAGLGDKGAIAVAEALLKLGSPQMLKSHGVRRWTVLLNDNGLTDRFSAHVSLLVSRCAPPVVLLDARGNAMTPAAIQRIEEARELSSAPCALRLPPTAGTAGVAAAASLRESASSASTAGGWRRGLDAEALRKRRSALFASGAASSTAVGSELGGRGRPRSRQSTGEAPHDVATVEVAARAPNSASGPAPEERSRRMEASGRRHSAGAGKGEKREEEAPPRGGDCGEPLDVTANLSPLLTVVLDLSNAVPTGRLQALYGTDDIWSVVASSGEAVSCAFPPEQTPFLRAGVKSTASFHSLTVLCIRKNCLESLKVLPPSLLRLDVSENELRELTGVGQCRMLTLLNARRNRLQSIRGLERNLALSHLFLAYNEIAFVEGIAHLLLLETLDLAHNRLKTQVSIRPLSLARGLRHLLLRGNPVVKCIKSSYRPVLRNLCPSLLSIDGERLTFSRFAAKAQQECSAIRIPYAHGDSIGGINVSLISAEDGKATNVTQCANYMHLLTRGTAVGAGSGYSDAARAVRTAKALQARGAANDKKGKKQRRPAYLADGEPLRKELLKRLAQESRKYLESMLEERLSNIQVSHVYDNLPGSGESRDGNNESEGLSNDTSAQRESSGKGSGPHLFSGDRNQKAPEFTQGLFPVEVASEKNIEKHRTIPLEKKMPAVHRDATLDHEQWLRLRECRIRRSAPFGDTPQRISPSPKTPDISYTKSEEKEVYISPIRKNHDECQAASINVTEILPDMEMLDSRFLADGKVSGEPKGRPRLVKSDLGRPMLLSPSAECSPVKAHRVYSSLQSQKDNKPILSSSPTPLHGVKAANEPVIFSPPPPLFSPCSLHSNARSCAVKKWVNQLREDAEAVQEALETLVSILDSRWWSKAAITGKPSFIPPEVLEERKRCVDILTESGMLLDTEIPLDVVEYYHFTPDELRHTGEEDYGEEDDCAANPLSVVTACESCREKREILHCIRVIGDGKTCLRYLVLLIEEMKEEELQQYVNELQLLTTCE
ncbi:hypothetical protein ECC02_001798 [Trypanosoma cruzi]|uniref:Leucine-rich repeat protein (LRRP) n=1 Tax=Trypanosoma cruzi TaxID=5693 RepID=A0A7J6YF74_TRYCR|nr:hypothetical protein ECC02_001798 [Trypanosoma cruzi]